METLYKLTKTGESPETMVAHVAETDTVHYDVDLNVIDNVESSTTFIVMPESAENSVESEERTIVPLLYVYINATCNLKNLIKTVYINDVEVPLSELMVLTAGHSMVSGLNGIDGTLGEGEYLVAGTSFDYESVTAKIIWNHIPTSLILNEFIRYFVAGTITSTTGYPISILFSFENVYIASDGDFIIDANKFDTLFNKLADFVFNLYDDVFTADEPFEINLYTYDVNGDVKLGDELIPRHESILHNCGKGYVRINNSLLL